MILYTALVLLSMTVCTESEKNSVVVHYRVPCLSDMEGCERWLTGLPWRGESPDLLQPAQIVFV